MTYLHHTCGRLRLRCQPLRRNSVECEMARLSLSVITGVRAAAANPLTGSLTIHYDPATLAAGRLEAALRVMGYLEGAPAPTRYLRKPALPKLPAITAAVPTLSSIPAPTRRAAGAAAGTLVKMAAGVLVEKAVERAVAAAVCAVL
jgi:hypothetical protein